MAKDNFSECWALFVLIIALLVAGFTGYFAGKTGSETVEQTGMQMVCDHGSTYVVDVPRQVLQIKCDDDRYAPNESKHKINGTFRVDLMDEDQRLWMREHEDMFVFNDFNAYVDRDTQPLLSQSYVSDCYVLGYVKFNITIDGKTVTDDFSLDSRDCLRAPDCGLREYIIGRVQR